MSNLMDPDLDELRRCAPAGSEPLVQSVIRDYMRDALLGRARPRARLRDGVDVDDGGGLPDTHGAVVLASPAGIDLTDPAATRAVVRRELLAGISATPGLPERRHRDGPAVTAVTPPIALSMRQIWSYRTNR